MSDDDRENSDYAISLAKPIAEKYLDVFTTALAATPGQEWRSPGMQVSMLTGAIAWAIDDARLAERERCATVVEQLPTTLIEVPDERIELDDGRVGYIKRGPVIHHPGRGAFAAAIRKGSIE